MGVGGWASGLAGWTGDRMVLSSNPAAATSLRNFGNSLYPALLCLSEETLRTVGPVYLVSMPGEVKDPTSPHWKCVTVVDSTTLLRQGQL